MLQSGTIIHSFSLCQPYSSWCNTITLKNVYAQLLGHTVPFLVCVSMCSFIGTDVDTYARVAQCISNLHTKCATHTCLHANRPPLALNGDFNEQVLGGGTKGIKQLISPDCRQPCSSELDGA